jgi:hypothetical protein
MHNCLDRCLQRVKKKLIPATGGIALGAPAAYGTYYYLSGLVEKVWGNLPMPNPDLSYFLNNISILIRGDSTPSTFATLFTQWAIENTTGVCCSDAFLIDTNQSLITCNNGSLISAPCASDTRAMLMRPIMQPYSNSTQPLFSTLVLGLGTAGSGLVFITVGAVGAYCVYRLYRKCHPAQPLQEALLEQEVNVPLSDSRLQLEIDLKGVPVLPADMSQQQIAALYEAASRRLPQNNILDGESPMNSPIRKPNRTIADLSPIGLEHSEMPSGISFYHRLPGSPLPAKSRRNSAPASSASASASLQQSMLHPNASASLHQSILPSQSLQQSIASFAEPPPAPAGVSASLNQSVLPSQSLQQSIASFGGPSPDPANANTSASLYQSIDL